MVKQEEDEVSGELSFLWGCNWSCCGFLYWDCYIEAQEENGRGPRLRTDSQCNRLSPDISASRKPDLITVLVTALESGEIVANPSNKNTYENKV